MKSFYTILIIAAIVGLAIGCNKNNLATDDNVGIPVQFETPNSFPPIVYDLSQNPLTEQGIAMGHMLFYDGRLSKDGQFPCASCHQQVAAFGTFAHDLSHGFNNSHTLRNAPPLQNLAWHTSFHHDGGINHLDVQPLAPITSPIEMAETIESVLAKLNADNDYKKLNQAAFGTSTISTKTMTQALSQFMVTMVSANSKYDQVMAGKATFNLPESLGYGIFKQKCATCHTEPLFTDGSFRNTGFKVDNVLQDYGRYRITKDPADSMKFKVPSLRNAMLSYPYGHDGRVFDIYGMLEHYNTGIVQSTTLDPLLTKGLGISEFEKGQLVAFLMSLTDSSFIQNKALGQPQ